MTNQISIRPGVTMELETPGVVQRPGTNPHMREVRLRCDATTPDTVELNLRGPGPGRWQLDRGQLARALIAATPSPGQGTDSGDAELFTAVKLASTEPTVALSGTKVVVSRRSSIGVTRVWLPMHAVNFFLDCCDQRIDQGAPAVTAQEPR